MPKKRPKLLHVKEAQLHHPNPQNVQQQDDRPQPRPGPGPQEEELIPGLPDDIAQLCLSKVHPKYLYPVCPSWRSFLYSPLCPPFLSLYTILTPNSPSSQNENGGGVTPIHFSSFDPISSTWRHLPPPPDPPIQLLLRHPSFISRNLPIQSVSADDALVLVAATTQHLLPALPRPLIFHPRGRRWGYAPDIPVPRRWCAAGSLRGSVYVASGVGSHFSSDTARALESWDGRGGRWRGLRGLRDGRFSRESVEAVGWRGKLCMVNVKGDAAKQGAVYDSEADEWGEMAEGMVGGWRGPAAAMEEEVMYAVDVSKGALRRYEEAGDAWVEVVQNERLRGAKQMAARAGRVCVVCGDGLHILVLDVAAIPVRCWVVEPPSGFKALAVHVLPRLG